MTKPERLCRLVVLGEGGVGKTALTIQLCLNHFVETYDPTIEDSHRKLVTIDDQSTMLEILDTAGQEAYTALLDQHLRYQDGYIVVYSITNKPSFDSVAKFIEKIYQNKGRPSPLGPASEEALAEDADKPPLPIMLIGNKADRGNEREVQTIDALKLAKQLYNNKNRVPGGKDMFYEASAKNDNHVEEAFFDLVREIRRQSRGSGINMFGSKDRGDEKNAGGSTTKVSRKLSKCNVM